MICRPWRSQFTLQSKEKININNQTTKYYRLHCYSIFTTKHYKFVYCFVILSPNINKNNEFKSANIHCAVRFRLTFFFFPSRLLCTYFINLLYVFSSHLHKLDSKLFSIEVFRGLGQWLIPWYYPPDISSIHNIYNW